MDQTTQLKDLQARHKTLTAQRDGLIRDVATEERKLEEIYEQLRALGVENPEKYSSKELSELSTKLEKQLETKLRDMTALLEKGEALMAQYQEI